MEKGETEEPSEERFLVLPSTPEEDDQTLSQIASFLDRLIEDEEDDEAGKGLIDLVETWAEEKLVPAPAPSEDEGQG